MQINRLQEFHPTKCPPRRYIRKAFGPEDSSPYPVIENKFVLSVKDWESVIKYQHKSLRLDDEKLKGISYDVFVDCRWPENQ